MAGDLRVSLKLTAEDLLNPVIVEALSKLQLLQQATDRLNGQAAAAAAGPSRLAEAEAQAAQHAGLLSGALHAAGETANRFGSEFIGGMARIAGSLIGFEAAMRVFEGVKEAAVELEQANRRLTARFGEAAGEYREFAEQAAEGTNFTAVAFERASAALQPLMRDYGLTDEQLKGLLRTTADLAAANSVGLADAASMVAATMRGQTRAGAELGLNLRTNVIASMDGLTEAEKAAVASGDTLAGAQARLHVINLEATSSLGQASAAAGETGDQFARLGKASGDLFETLAKAPVIGSLANDLATAATSGANLIRIMERLAELRREDAASETNPQLPVSDVNPHANRGGILQLDRYLVEQKAEAEAATRRIAAAGEAVTTTQALLALADAAQRPLSLGLVPEEGKHWSATTTAVRSLTSAEGELSYRTYAYTAAVEETARSSADLFTRHTQGADDIATAWTRAQIELNRYSMALKIEQGTESQLEAAAATLRADRGRRARLGLPALAGETDMIRALGRAEYGQQGKVGEAAMQDAAALLAKIAAGDDPLGLGKVQVGTQQVTAGTVIVNGPAGGGQQSAISGGGAGRYDGARSTGPAYQGGLGRFGQ